MESREIQLADLEIRQATQADSVQIAMLCLSASNGIAEAIWSRIEMPGSSLIDVGAYLCAREGDDVIFSFINCMMAEYRGEMVGMFHSYPMHPGDKQETKISDPVYRQFFEIPEFDGLFVSIIAVYPQFHGNSIGSCLLERAKQKARDLGLSRIGIFCFEENKSSMEALKKWGFVEREHRPIIPHPMLHYRIGDAVLLFMELP